MSLGKKIFWALVFLVLYAVTSVPVGLFLYSLKSEAGIDVFTKTGFHGYMDCLKQEAERAR